MKTFKEFMNEGSDIEKKALQLAIKKHKGQIRKFSGKPYVVHPIRVAKILKNFTSDSDMIAAAYLHDTVEDTNTTLDELKQEFNSRVSSLVKELTNIKDDIKKLGKAEFLSKKMIGMSADALLIKLVDRLDNVSDAGDPSFKKRYRAETEFILDKLEKGRSLTGQHKKLINMIQKTIGR